MAIMSQTFPEQPESAIASYDWTDIAEGAGYINFFPAKYTTAVTPTYENFLLSENFSWPYARIGHAGIAGTTSTTSTELNVNSFDTTMNFHKIINGTVLVLIHFHARITGSTDAVGEVKYTLQIRNGTKDTLLGEATTETFTATNTNITHHRLVKITVSNGVIGRGEILRFKVIPYGKAGTGDGTPTVYPTFLCDPLNQVVNITYPGSTATITPAALSIVTDLRVSIPFKLDL